MSPENLSPAEPQPAGMSEASRLTGVFFEPKKTFEDVARRPSFVVPLLLTIVVNLIFTVLLSQHVGWARIVRQQQELNPRAQQQMANLSPEQRERANAMTQTITPIISYCAAILGTPF